MEDYVSLSEFIKTLNFDEKVHISVEDVSGILSNQKLNIDKNLRIHSKEFCNIAKSTNKGYSLCLKCKYLANKKAITEKKPFTGYCPYGLYEIAYPIVSNNKTCAIIYIGNIVTDKNVSIKKAKKACNITKVNYNRLDRLFKETYKTNDLSKLLSYAKIIDSYIRLIDKTNISSHLSKDVHWLINELKTYAHENYRSNIMLKNTAQLYFFNEKYAGRLFKQNVGISYSEYVNNIRLENAKKDIIHTQNTIIEISNNNGFENVTYFNKLFKKHFGMSPTKFRNYYKNHKDEVVL